jgi:hypothetical protein
VEIPVEMVQKAQYVQREGGHNTTRGWSLYLKKTKSWCIATTMQENPLQLLTMSGQKRMYIPAAAAPATLRFEFEKKTGAEKFGAGGI